VWNSFSVPKAWIEIKEMKNGVIDGNDMYSGVGSAIAMTARNQDGASPWCVIENVTFTNNRIRGYKWGFSLLLTDNEQPTVMSGNIVIRNNLFSQPKPVPNVAAAFVQLVGGHDVTVEHNTIVQPGSPVVGDQPTQNFVFRNNVVANYQYGMQCTMGGGLSACWPNLVMNGNVVIDTRWNKADGSLANIYPAGNYYPASPANVGFTDLANDNYGLSAASPYKYLATDGTDPGVDMIGLLAAIGGSALPNPSSTPVPLPMASASVTFVQIDTTTQGNWKNSYGADGYNVINDSTAYPAYAQVSPLSSVSYLWGSTSATQALQKAGATDRIAACWYQSPSFSIDVNITDGQVHKIALYALDWDAASRTETIDVVDAGTNALLDSRTLSSFAGGKYAVWNIKGHVKFNVTKSSGSTNAVISGLFFGGPTSNPTPTPTPTPLPTPTPIASAAVTFVQIDTTTQGNWKNSYGAEGYNVINDTTAYPAYAQVRPLSSVPYVWAGGTSATQALQKAGTTDRIAGCWYQSPSFSIDVNITDGQVHKIALYALDWDAASRTETIDIVDAGTNALLDSRTVSSFAGGKYAVWNIKGHVKFNVTKSSGSTNAVISGLFFGGPTSNPTPTATPTPSPMPIASAAVTFVHIDSTTQGNWKNSYGADGYNVINDSTRYPAYAQVSPLSSVPCVWTSSTTATQALQKAGATDRIAACWYQSPFFSIDVNITDGQAHKIALYALDWDAASRTEIIDVVDAGTNALLDSRTLSSFAGGKYAVWNIKGHVKFNVTRSSGSNAVISGLFFGGP
jgi:hypothetical protein